MPKHVQIYLNDELEDFWMNTLGAFRGQKSNIFNVFIKKLEEEYNNGSVTTIHKAITGHYDLSWRK